MTIGRVAGGVGEEMVEVRKDTCVVSVLGEPHPRDSPSFTSTEEGVGEIVKRG